MLAVILGIIIYQAASGNYASLPENIVGTVATPVIKASSAVSEGISGFFNRFINAKNTQKENEKLKTELSDALNKLSDFEVYKKENEELKKYLGIKEQNADYKMEQARVIGRDSSSDNDKFTVNKGSLNGVELNNPVITSEGLVGIVSHVGATYSVVTTISDSGINVGAYNSRTQETGVISGDASVSDKSKTKLKHLSRHTALLPGDIIETSGIGGVFPEGILIGTIDEIKAENSGVSMYAVVSPIVDVNKVNNVMIIKNFLVGENKDTKSSEK